MRTYSVRYVHKVAPKATDTGTADLPDGSFSDIRTFAHRLRMARVLCSGERLREMRVEGDRVLAFPDRGIWHCIVLTAQ